MKKEKATIYFQFSNDEAPDIGVLERVTHAYNGFRKFYTCLGYSLSISEFVEYVKTNDQLLFDKPKPKEAPQVIGNGKTINELWKDYYFGMIVYNLHNNKFMLINGRQGEMYRDFSDRNKIVGKYGYYYQKKGRYVFHKKYYIVWDYDKSIWVLIKEFLDENYQNKAVEL
ncbi:TPA: hypothetical protein GXZ54_01055 [bacterium]|nr:hypothetical protein [bacterium]